MTTDAGTIELNIRLDVLGRSSTWSCRIYRSRCARKFSSTFHTSHTADHSDEPKAAHATPSTPAARFCQFASNKPPTLANKVPKIVMAVIV